MEYAERVRSLGREEMIEELLKALEDLEALKADLRKTREQLKSLMAENAELKRARHRPSVPFSKNKGKDKPKRPGRRPGKGKFTNRAKPKTDGPAHDVGVSAGQCPDCAGAFEADGFEEVSIEDVPPIPEPETRVFRMQICKCVNCGKRVRACHPDVPADQTGATAHRMGPRIKAVALVLHYGVGVPLRRVPGILATLTGIKVTQSAITQLALTEASRGITPVVYDQLRAGVADSPRVFTDDTGWSVNRQTAYVMGFETDDASIFQIRPQHRNEEVREVIPADYKGVVNCDRGPSYEAKELARLQQQKCHSHIDRNLAESMEKQPPQARVIGRKLRCLLAGARAIHKKLRAGEMDRETFDKQGEVIDRDVTYLLRDRAVSDPENQKIINEIGVQHDRGHLLRFLKNPAVDPTNNQAERMLRDIVIARKVSQCSKTWDGANACAMFKSLHRTMARRGMDVIEGFVSVLTGTNPLAPNNSS